MRLSLRATAALVFLLVNARGEAAPLNPNDFTSLGTLNVSSGTLNINTTTGVMSGAASATAVFRGQSEGLPIAVFTFNSITVGPSVLISVTGTRPLALLSKTDLSLSPTIDLSPIGTTPRAGGYEGGGVSGGSGFDGVPGAGPGGGGFLSTLASGAGHGGAGAGTSNGGAGGSAYGALLENLTGGSGGGAATNGSSGGSGGAGGGALELGALGNLSTGPIFANGGNANASNFGGGAGGGVLIHAEGTLSLGAIQAVGSTGSTSNGGGGRIAVLGLANHTLGSISAGSAFGGPAAEYGVITHGAKLTTIPGGRSALLDGNSIVTNVDIGDFPPSRFAKIETLIERDLTINAGGTATLGKDGPLLSGSALVVNGTFNTGAYSQTVGSLTGSGTISLGEGGKLTAGGNNTTSTYSGQITGTGTLGKVGGGTLTLSSSVAIAGGVDVQQGTVKITGTVFPNPGFLVKTGSGTLEINGSLDRSVRVQGGELKIANAPSGFGSSLLTVDVNSTLNIQNSPVSHAVEGLAPSSLITTSGTSSMLLTRHAGRLVVGGGSLTLTGTGFRTLGHTTQVNAATLSADGIALGSGSLLTGSGAVNARIAASLGSTIESTGALAIGSATSVAGFTSEGEIRVGPGSTLTINDRNEAVLGSLTTLGSSSGLGTLAAGSSLPTPVSPPAQPHHHFLLQEGKNLTGVGTIVGNFRNNGHVIGDDNDGDGVAEPTDGNNDFDDGEGLLFAAAFPGNPTPPFNWKVTGIGTFENVTFDADYAPGLSPGMVDGVNLTIGRRLEIELGGAGPGNGAGNHDQLNDLASLGLGAASTLDLRSYGAYLPVVGQDFEIVTSQQPIEGAFSAVTIDPWFLVRGIGFEVEESAHSVVATAVAVSGDFTGDGRVDGHDFVLWQRSLGQQGGNLGADGNGDGAVDGDDLAVWQAQAAAAQGSVFASGGAVPEPASWGLVLTALAGLSRRLRRS